MQQILPSLLERPILFAHRGARAHAPENTVDAFSLALRLGANGLETDAWSTIDGAAVLDHDGVVRRKLKKVPFAEILRRDLPPSVPTLTDVFSHCGTDFHLSVDVKDVDALPRIVGDCDAAGFDRRHLWLCHPDVETLRDWRRGFDAVRLVNSTRLQRLDEPVEKRLATLASIRVDAINLPHDDWTGGLATLAHRFELAAFAWDVHQQHRAVELLRMGVDAIYGDHVDRLVDAHRERYAEAPWPPSTPTR